VEYTNLSPAGREPFYGERHAYAGRLYEVLGDLADAFEEDLRRELTSSDPTGQLAQTIGFAYELARCPP